MNTNDIIDSDVNMSLPPSTLVQPDHEVQMARSDLYRAAQSSIKLHEMLKKISETQGLEGWVQAKITKAADYLESVYHYLDYEMQSKNIEMEAAPVAPGAVAPGTVAPAPAAVASQNPAVAAAAAAKAAADAKKNKQAQIRAIQADIQAKQKQIADLTRSMNMPATVAETKNLGKRVRIVSGSDAGKYGWIRQIKLGQFKGAPRKFDVDLDDGGQANGLPDTALRLAKEPTSVREAASAGASSAGGVATAIGGNGFKHGGPGTLKRAKKPAEEGIVKNIKRGLKGWPSPGLNGKDQGKPKDVVARVRSSDDDFLKKVTKQDAAPHSPAGLQKAAATQELKRREKKTEATTNQPTKEGNESMPSGAKAAHTMGMAHGAKGAKKIDADKSFGVYSKWYHRGYEQAAGSDEWREKQKLIRASNSKRGVNNENIGQTKLDELSKGSSGDSDPKLLLNTTEKEFNEVVRAFQNWASTNSWKIKKYKHSAMVDYEAKNAKGDTVVLSGWHGTGSFGTGKAILTLFVGGKATDLLDVLDVKWAGPWGYFTSDSAKTQYLNNLARLVKMFSSNFKNMQEEVEKLDELSAEKLGRYIKAASGNRETAKVDNETDALNFDFNDPRRAYNRNKISKRAGGIRLAANKLAGDTDADLRSVYRPRVSASEETHKYDPPLKPYVDDPRPLKNYKIFKLTDPTKILHTFQFRDPAQAPIYARIWARRNRINHNFGWAETPHEELDFKASQRLAGQKSVKEDVSTDPADQEARDSYGFSKSSVTKLKDGTYLATDSSGNRKQFKSKASAEKHASSKQ